MAPRGLSKVHISQHWLLANWFGMVRVSTRCGAAAGRASGPAGGSIRRDVHQPRQGADSDRSAQRASPGPATPPPASASKSCQVPRLRMHRQRAAAAVAPFGGRSTWRIPEQAPGHVGQQGRPVGRVAHLIPPAGRVQQVAQYLSRMVARRCRQTVPDRFVTGTGPGLRRIRALLRRQRLAAPYRCAPRRAGRR